MRSERTLETGWVRIRTGGIVKVRHDPELAALLLHMRGLDRQIIRDCLEGS